jgi:hypothetical protein
MNFAVQHLLAAARFSRRVGEIESENKDNQFGPFWEEVLHFSTACIFSSVASLEAYANETYADREHILSDEARELLDNFSKKSRRRL